MTTLGGTISAFHALLSLSSVIGHGGNRRTNVSTVNIPLVTNHPWCMTKWSLMGGGCLQEKSRT